MVDVTKLIVVISPWCMVSQIIMPHTLNLYSAVSQL